MWRGRSRRGGSEGAESEGENEWGPSHRGKSRGGGVRGGESVGAESEGWMRRGRSRGGGDNQRGPSLKGR